LWIKTLTAILADYKLFPRGNKPCLFSRVLENVTPCAAVYVDDIILASVMIEEIESFPSWLINYLDITDLGIPKYMLGIEFDHSEAGVIKLHQTNYLKQLLLLYNLHDVSPQYTPVSVSIISLRNTAYS
jgi:Reverse transcriptase (RNA-dependent DNA polymerase)